MKSLQDEMKEQQGIDAEAPGAYGYIKSSDERDQQYRRLQMKLIQRRARSLQHQEEAEEDTEE